MTGTVSERFVPVIRVVVRGPQGQERSIEAIVDTGFNDFLSLPLNAIASLGLLRRRAALSILADGTSVLASTYTGEVIWNGQTRRVEVVASEGDMLVGTRLMEGCRLSVDIVPGGQVIIEPLAAE